MTRDDQIFTKELLILLKLIDQTKLIILHYMVLGLEHLVFFQFMPSTIKNHAIDFNNDNYIDLKNLKMLTLQLQII